MKTFKKTFMKFISAAMVVSTTPPAFAQDANLSLLEIDAKIESNLNAIKDASARLTYLNSAIAMINKKTNAAERNTFSKTVAYATDPAIALSIAGLATLATAIPNIDVSSSDEITSIKSAMHEYRWYLEESTKKNQRF
ncbi:hypothetical protein DOM22_13000 [Bdellovibrio sp. ZAP7]|uniref:hypothetical protein n=1 Tax=Bdellovibrio sp. ZAP7 TaxID=2231053 RepID=UPI001159F8EC|nr:hypothetical protein [Bdellovibrio sp. ZAP7]QDK46005.1 hypothetical protein DOM22_13000 [Bdellovibrio sp. ZAP7]